MRSLCSISLVPPLLLLWQPLFVAWFVIAGMTPTIVLWFCSRCVLAAMQQCHRGTCCGSLLFCSCCTLGSPADFELLHTIEHHHELADMTHGTRMSTIRRHSIDLNDSLNFIGTEHDNAVAFEVVHEPEAGGAWWRVHLTSSERRLIWVSPILATLLFVCLYTWFVSLPRTAVSNNLAVENSQSIFVFLFSVLLLHERIRPLHVVAVLVCGGGVLVILLASPADAADDAGSQPQQIHETIGGYLAVLLSTIFSSLYQVLYAKWMASDDASDAKLPPIHASKLEREQFFEELVQTFAELGLFLGLLGLFTLVFLWPLLVVAHFTGLETFQWPTHREWYQMLISCASNIAFYFAMASGTQLTSALWVSVGLLASIPASIITDYLLHHYLIEGWGWAGVALIISGFLLMNLQEYLKQRNP
jgi:drug/metabolite transporter (DMT)-like permease